MFKAAFVSRIERCGAFALAAFLAFSMPSLAGAQAAQMVFQGGTIFTADAQQPFAEAVAVAQGRIVFVGAQEDIAPWIGEETQVIDLAGRMLVPGFVDAHNHLVWSGTSMLDANLWEAQTTDELLEAIRDHAAAEPDAIWVRGAGWDLSAFPGDLLTKELLDSAVADRPAYMEAADAHSAWVNSRALEFAGITRDIPDPQGGQIVRDAEGNPTGLLREAAVHLVTDFMPDYSWEQREKGLLDALFDASAYGITTIVDPAVKDWMIDTYQAFEEDGLLSLRVRAAYELKPDTALESLSKVKKLWGETYDTGPLFQLTQVKLFLDGVIEGKTAYMLAPYSDDGTNGAPIYSDSLLQEIITLYDKERIDIHIHAIGDAAIRQALDALEAANFENGVWDSRHQIAHLQVIDPADLPRFAELGVIANFQPLWAYPDSYITDLTIPVIGEERAKNLYPIGGVAKAGWKVAFGSDWSVSSMNPLEGIEVALTRRDPWEDDPTGPALEPSQAISLEEALMAYTIDAAFAARLEGETGSITVGKLADLVILTDDLFTLEPHEISNVKVLFTYLGGNLIYSTD